MFLLRYVLPTVKFAPFRVLSFDSAYSHVGLPWWLSSKESACSAGDAEDAGSIPGSGRFPGMDMLTHSSILAWRIPWTEEPGGLQSMGSHRVNHD